MSMFGKVNEWLEKGGYPLEMRAAAAFREVGFPVRQSTYYVDAETSKAREIDVQAEIKSDIGLVNINFFVECKSGKNPWVLFCSQGTLKGFHRLQAFCAMSYPARVYFSENIVRLMQEFPWLKKDGVVGAYSMRQAHSGDADPVYPAAMNVCNVCSEGRIAPR